MFLSRKLFILKIMNIIVFTLTYILIRNLNLRVLNDKIFLCYVYWFSLNTKSCFNGDWHGVEPSSLDHPVHQLPLSGEGVELQDFIVVGEGTVIVTTA